MLIYEISGSNIVTDDDENAQIKVIKKPFI
jgi:hypothetical protein